MNGDAAATGTAPAGTGAPWLRALVRDIANHPTPGITFRDITRLKLATHMGEQGGFYVLDEPTTGLHLADVDTTVIALWLGHQDVRSTQAHLHADLAIKERPSPGQAEDARPETRRSRPPTGVRKLPWLPAAAISLSDGERNNGVSDDPAV